MVTVADSLGRDCNVSVVVLLAAHWVSFDEAQGSQWYPQRKACKLGNNYLRMVDSGLAAAE